MDTPYGMRGRLYPGHLTARCADFAQCELCFGCRRYDAASVVCRICESGHKEKLICKHGERQWETIRSVTNALKRPMTHPDYTGSQSYVVNVDPNSLATQLGDKMYENIVETPSRPGDPPLPKQIVEG